MILKSLLSIKKYVPPWYISCKQPVSFSILVGEFKTVPILSACIQTTRNSDQTRNLLIRGYDNLVQNANWFLGIPMYLQLPNMLIKASLSVWYDWWRLKSIFLAIPTPSIFTFTYLELGFLPPPTAAPPRPLSSAATVQLLWCLFPEQIFFLRNLIGGQPTIQFPSSFLFNDINWN